MLIILLMAVISCIIMSMILFTPDPPVAEMEYARKCLADAGKSNAATYSAKLFNEAMNAYDSAMANWQKENRRFIFVRDYSRVQEFANISAEKAVHAAESSVSNSLGLKARTAQKIDTLNKIIAEINGLFNAYPLEPETRNRISKGRMLLEEAAVNHSKGNYLEANMIINESEQLLTSSLETASELLKDYFKSYKQWKTWTDRAIRDSRRTGGYSIIVDKFSRKLYVYHKGVKKMEFDAELGKNWVGDKRIRGDHATPEGMYKVAKKMDASKTKYHKAFLLDYPNAEDVAKFKSEISKGTLPATAKIGGLIEIHGNGGKGIDWTEGCVALTDKDMDVIYRIIPQGTPVTIVGSTVDLPEIMKK